MQPDAPDDDASSVRRTRTLWAWSTLGAGAALAATAAALYGVGVSRGESAHDAYTAAAAAAPGPPDDELAGHYDDIESARDMVLAGNILMGAAAVAAGVSIYLFVTRPAEPGGEGVTAVGVAPLARGASLGLSGRF